MSSNECFIPSDDQIDKYADALEKLAIKIYYKQKITSEQLAYEVAARILAAHIMRIR